MTDRPNKKMYENQKEIIELIIKELKKKYLKDFSKAYLTGSLTSGKFGTYEEEYEGYFGSDIDLAGIPKSLKKDWIYKGVFYDWHQVYQIGIIEIKGTKHPINLMIPLKQNLKLLFDKSEELNLKLLRLK